MARYESYEQFQQAHPQAAEAMKLFGMTWQEYLAVREAMTPKKTYISTGTTMNNPLTYLRNATTVETHI